MSLLTLEVEIANGQVSMKEPHLLPQNGRGLLTILDAEKAAPFQEPRAFGCLKGKISMTPDFDAPLEDFKEYME